METLILLLLLGADPASLLDQGTKEVSAYHAREAVELLERARAAGPYRYADHIRLYEQLGIAYAYLDDKDDALAAFDMLLALDPGYAISYTLSPKVTFLFEEARKQAASRPAPSIYLGWPRDLGVDDPVPIEVEVLSDPKGFFHRARLDTRRKGTEDFSGVDLDLSVPGGYQRVVLPAAAPAAEHPVVLQVRLVAFDASGNEVFETRQLREIPLVYEEPVPWYSRWWVWAIVGGLVAAGTSTAVYLSGREPPDNLGGGFRMVFPGSSDLP